MRIVAKTEHSDIATVYIAESEPGKLIECVESLQPPEPMEKKWVLLLSTLFGCPIGCQFCDSGWHYQGKLSKEQIFEQIDFLITQKFPDRIVPVKKFKIQFARMGEPALNKAVLDVLEEFDSRYDAPGFLPSISTVAPKGTEAFFESLLEIKKRKYNGRFQMQFSIHSTNQGRRDELIPVKKWDFAQIAEYGKRFYSEGDRKITLNFALAEGSEISSQELLKYFDPNYFLIKITPVNPTSRASKNQIISEIFTDKKFLNLIKSLEIDGFETILSIGEPEENKIGSNCGQYITYFLKQKHSLDSAYTYNLQPFN